MPMVFLVATLILVTLAMARPQIPGPPINKTIPGRDIELVVDISFSMNFKFKGEIAPHETPKGLEFTVPFEEARKSERGLHFTVRQEGLERINAAQDALLRFIENRWEKKTGDRMGLIVFSVWPRYAWPITDDLRMLYRHTQLLDRNLGTGTNFGKEFPGPIDLAVQHFKEYGQAKSRVIVMVTDGEDRIPGSTINRLVQVMKENNVRFYLIGIGETMTHQDVDIYQVARGVNGKVFRVEDAGSLNGVFAEIDRMEKSEVTTSQLETRDDVFFVFAWGALAAFGLFLLSEALIMAR
jgi:Ca-activated chloride channel family protein